MPAALTDTCEAQARREPIRFASIGAANDPRLTDGYTPSELEVKLAEMLLIDRYKAGDLSIGEVAEMIGVYPDIEAAMNWMNRRGVVQIFDPTSRTKSRALNAQIVSEARFRLK